MKKIYIQPEMLAVELQLCQIIADSGFDSNIKDFEDGGQAGDGVTGDVKEGKNVWDEEW